MRRRNHRALTLVEVLVSILIGALILSGLAAPMAVGVINRRQSQLLTQATHVAQAEVEAIRSFWQDASNSSDPLKTQGQLNFDSNSIRIAWNTSVGNGCTANAGATITSLYSVNSTLTANDTTNGLLSDPAQVASNSSSIPASVDNLAIDVDGDCVQDFWGQVFLGRPPDETGTSPLLNARRVVVRIYRAQSNPAMLTATPVNPVRQMLFDGAPGQQSSLSTRDQPLAVLIADITRS